MQIEGHGLGAGDKLLSSLGFCPLGFEKEVYKGHLVLTCNFLGKGPLWEKFLEG